MTTEIQQEDKITLMKNDDDDDDIPHEILDIFEEVCCNKSVMFKSQQMNDPELTHLQKLEVMRDAYSCNRLTFLQRFGRFLNEQQLDDFTNFGLQQRTSAIAANANLEDIALLIDSLKRKLHTRAVSVKNRRYMALKELIQKGEYFSEHEMMRRAPELYQEMVGKYLTDAERKQRDNYDVRNTTFSGILMHTLEQQQLNELLQNSGEREVIKAAVTDNLDTQTNQSVNDHQIAYVDDEVPSSYRKRWGGFDNDDAVCTTSNIGVIRTNETELATQDLITASEQELLRNEFLSRMHEQFLAGEDKDFDYSALDDNSQLDDLQQYHQDLEDAYFDESEEEPSNTIKNCPKKVSTDEESEDELDVFMKHLENHHSLQNKNKES